MECEISGVVVVELEERRDVRGSFVETWRMGDVPGFVPVQGNKGERVAGSLVGMHYHLEQADYWYIPVGVVDVVLWDLRVGSPSEGVVWRTTVGAGDERPGIYIPPGVAHGFYVVTDMMITYLVDREYGTGEDEHGVAWNDPGIVGVWDLEGRGSPVLSGRDLKNPFLNEIENLPKWR